MLGTSARTGWIASLEFYSVTCHWYIDAFHIRSAAKSWLDFMAFLALLPLPVPLVVVYGGVGTKRGCLNRVCHFLCKGFLKEEGLAIFPKDGQPLDSPDLWKTVIATSP